MFLATLDTSISEEVLNTLYEANIQVTTTKSIKEKYYPNNERVLTFENLIWICKENYKTWDNFGYTLEQNEKIIELINKQIGKHKNHRYVQKYYQVQLDNMKA